MNSWTTSTLDIKLIAESRIKNDDVDLEILADSLLNRKLSILHYISKICEAFVNSKLMPETLSVITFIDLSSMSEKEGLLYDSKSGSASLTAYFGFS